MKIKNLNNPLCPKCNIPMDIHTTMGGDRYSCDNYHICGCSIPVENIDKDGHGET